MNRRSILAAIMGAAAAPQAVSAKIASELTGVSLNPPPHPYPMEAPCGPPINGWWQHPLRDALEAKAHVYERPEENYPPHIRAMKSWSGTYKASVYAREVQAYRQFHRMMDDPDNFTKLLRLLGGDK